MKMKFDVGFCKSLFFIALPIILQNFVNAFINILDTIMVGSLGKIAIASVGIGNNVFFFFNMIIFGLCTGCGVFVSQFWGKNDIKSIRKSTGMALLAGLSITILFVLLIQFAPEKVIGFYTKNDELFENSKNYLLISSFSFPLYTLSMVYGQALRSVELPQIPMASSIISLLSNVCLNYILIFGKLGFPRLGIQGAAIATVAARIIDCTILLMILYLKKLPPAGKIRELFAFSKTFVKKFFKIVTPVICNETIWGFGVTLQNIIFSRTGTNEFASFNITGTVSQLTWTFLFGGGAAAGVLVGKKIGEGKNDTAYSYAEMTCIILPITGIFMGLLLFPIGNMLHMFFNVDKIILSESASMLRILGLMYPINCMAMAMIVGICRSGGDTIFAGIVDVTPMYAVSIPLAALMSFYFHASATIIYFCLLTENIIKSVFLLYRLKSKKWLHNVTN